MAAKSVSPIRISPAGLLKLASVICPAVTVAPLTTAVTVPSGPMPIDVAPAGIVIAGLSTSPWSVTSRPVASVWSAPARVKAVVPSGRVTWKKPGPLIATSSGLPVDCRPPWVNCARTEERVVPRPTWIGSGEAF